MKVEITNISGAHDVLLAAGITSWLTEAGVEVVAPDATPRLLVRPVFTPDAPEPPAAPAPKPVTDRAKPVKRAAKAPSKSAEKREVSDEPKRPTDGMSKADKVRIALSNHGSPMTNSEIMRATGLGSQDVSVVLWSLKSQGEARKDESATPALWRLA